LSAKRKPSLEMAIVCAAYAAQRINSARNGMTSKFGWLQATAVYR
jgi:hypothetical protein